MSSYNKINQKTLVLGDYLELEIEGFLKDRKSQNLTKGTIQFYRNKLKEFLKYCETQEVKLVSQITPNLIRDYLLLLEERGHNSGGIHTYYRTVKTFLLWYEEEEEPENWKNPIRKVKAPRLVSESIEGVTREQFEALLAECENDYLGIRDKAILMVLYDTGIRANELCNIKLENINFIDNSILIEQGKGRKPRYVFFGKSTKKQLRKWIKLYIDTYLFTNQSGEKLVYIALRQIVRRIALKANLEGIGLHDFRRAFTLNCLNSGMAEITIARLLGHVNTVLIGRYAKQLKEHLQIAYKSPVDKE
jgi:site-specific recombinase XerD